ncbi:MAG: hypothetical protein ACE37B_16145 [Ilumatobacter sp.]|uniref:hypothetical protein n=1 Tax=Ilumatobacter sp. TaxID=1967498 RepID=UPI003919C3C0
MEVTRRTWTAAVKLAAVVSVVSVVIAVLASRFTEMPQAAIVLPVIVVAFVASWIQTGRVRQAVVDDRVLVGSR